jgi:alcohol dehydrogenase
MLLQAHGYEVRQFGHHAHKLRVAEAAGVATEVVTGPLPVAAFDWVVEATGSREGLRAAAALCRPRGVVILKSTLHGEVSFDAAPLVVNEITVVGSRCGRFEDALPLLARGIVPVEQMIAARYPLREAARAFEHAARPGTLKVLLSP